MSLKRSPSLDPSEEFDRSSKRRRSSPLAVAAGSAAAEEEEEGEEGISENGAKIEPEVARISFAPTYHANARAGIQRSIALVLRHDGFVSSTHEAAESFTSLVETYLESLIEETKRLALSSRRDYPSPLDFEVALKRFNLPISSLKPHLKNPLPEDTLAPKFQDVQVADEEAYATLPLLGPELSGRPDKEAKQYIPVSFPDFPSRHTYRFTPQEESKTRDSLKTREEAARTAQQGEDALRRLVRASKMRNQKEAKSLVEKDDNGRERFRLWESTMRRFMGTDHQLEYTDSIETADHTMIVNGDNTFARKEVSRVGKRPAVTSANVN